MISPVVLVNVLALTATGVAAEESIEHIEITEYRNSTALTSDLSSELSRRGIGFSEAGGISSLPVMHGLMGDRIQVLTDGAPITAACGNQMNPPLSYVSASQVQSVSILPGVSVVSAGGDNIAGVIEVDTLVPRFADSPEFAWSQGDLAFSHRDNDNRNTLAATLSAASEQWWVRYSGQTEQAASFENGQGEVVLDTLYQAQNHALAAAYKNRDQQVMLQVTHQNVPYQGFPIQYMDMTDNQSTGIVAEFQQKNTAGQMNAHLSWRTVKHEMGFFSAEKPGMMIMNTDANDVAAKLLWQWPLDGDETVQLGAEYFLHTLDDWWPAVEGSMMMGPNDYININDGSRQRAGLFAEWTQEPRAGWYYSAGVRMEQVTTDTGDVAPYNRMPMDMMSMGGGMGMAMTNVDLPAADAFNVREHERSDWLADITLLANRQVGDDQIVTFGLARKNRAPNLYERYSWGRGVMATTMIGWFGDANGYVGDIDLAPETAHTASISYSVDKSKWSVNANFWYTKVNDYIDGEVIGGFSRTGTEAGMRNILQFANLDATLKGWSLDGRAQLAQSGTGRWLVSNYFEWQQGQRDVSDEPLYQILPWQNRLRVTYDHQQWQAALEWQWVGDKDDVDVRRLENITDGYSLLNLVGQFNWRQLEFEVAVTNLLDEHYQGPLGGVSIAEYNREPGAGFQQLEGMGRAIDLGIRYRF